MFRAAHRSSSGALNCICSLWFIYMCGDRPLSRLSGLSGPLSLDKGRSPHGYTNQRLQIQFRAPDDERCAARNMFWNNKFYYKLHLVGYFYWFSLWPVFARLPVPANSLWLPSVPPVKCRKVPEITPRLFPSTSFPIHFSLSSSHSSCRSFDFTWFDSFFTKLGINEIQRR